MQETCQRCNKDGEDRRTLFMSCFYEMNELNLPFEIKQILRHGEKGEPLDVFHNFYTLRVCKSCRADWMIYITEWFNSKPLEIPSPGTGIYIRRLGATVEISEEEWNKMNPGREPVRFKQDETTRY